MMRLLVDSLFLIRPTLLLPVWTLLFWGTTLHRPNAWGMVGFPRAFWLALVSYSLLMGAIYVVNQIFDVETDRINQKLFLLSDGYLSLRHAWMEAILLVGVSLMLGWSLGTAYRWLWVFSLVLGVLYSVPPFVWKGRPFLDLLSNAVGYGGINVLVGWVSLHPWQPGLIPRTLPLVSAVGAVFLLTTIPDIPGDRAAGKRSTGVWLGARKTALLATVMLWLTVLFAARYGDLWVLSVAALSLPLFVAAVVEGGDRWVKLAYRAAGGLFGIATALRFPIFLLLGGLTFLALRLYYQRRFGLTYPSLRGR